MLLNEIKKEKGRSAQATHKGKVTVLRLEDIKVLQKECSDFIKNAKRPLFRGFNKSANANMTKVRIRKQRIPRDTPELGTAAFNVAFESLFAVKTIRNRSAFIIPNLYNAREYGTAYYVFPTNKAKFAIGKGVEDSMGYFDLEGFEGYLINTIEEDLEDYDDNVVQAERIVDFIESKIGPTNGIVTLSQMKKLLGDKFKYVQRTMQTATDFEDMKKVYKVYRKYTSAISKFTSEEIMMFDAPHYYAINADAVMEAFDDSDPMKAFAKLIQHIKAGKEVKIPKR